MRIHNNYVHYNKNYYIHTHEASYINQKRHFSEVIARLYHIIMMINRSDCFQNLFELTTSKNKISY